MDLERAKENFKNHVATFTDYGNIKILDFKRPESSEYRIRFLFEEDYCRLHISGDLGELIASNYNNMVYEKFSEFVNDVGYFEGKIDCHSRKIYSYDETDAEEDLRKLFEEYDIYDDIVAEKYEWETEGEKIREVIEEILCDFSNDTGIGSKGYEKLSSYIDDTWEVSGDIGKRNTGILDLYMLAFDLATKQLSERKEISK